MPSVVFVIVTERTSRTGSAEVIVAVTSITTDSGSVDMDETVSFNVQVVPEFAALTIIVMALSITTALLFSRFRRNWLN